MRDRDADGEPTGAARRYVVCRNAEQARRDKAVREATVEKLRARLSKGPKALVGNRGFKRYLEAKGKASRWTRAGSPPRSATTGCGPCG